MLANSQSSKLAGGSGEDKVRSCNLSARIRLFLSVSKRDTKFLIQGRSINIPVKFPLPFSLGESALESLALMQVR